MPSQVLGNMEFPLLGRIAAGQPVEAIPNAETFSFGDFTGGRGNLFRPARQGRLHGGRPHL
jgi:hypothetical protein